MIDDPGMSAALAAGVDDAKAYLRIEDDAEDAVIAALLGAAGGVVEAFLGQALIARAFRETLSVRGEWRRMARMPVRTIQLVEGLAEDGTAITLPIESYGIDIDINGDGWVRSLQPADFKRLAVTYQAGLAADWAGLPDMIRQGIIRLAAHLHAHRDADDERGPPLTVAALLRPWRRMRLA